MSGFQNAFIISPLAVYGSVSDDSVSSYIWSTNTAQRCISLCIAAICMTAALVLQLAEGNREVLSAYAGAGLSGLFILRFDFWRQVLISRRKLHEVLLCDVVNRTAAITFLSVALLFYEHISIIYFYLCNALASGISSTLAGFVARSHVRKCDKRERWEHLNRNWFFGKWVSADYAITIGTGQIGPYFLASMLGAAATGVFGAVIQLTGVMHVFLNGVANYAYPLLVKRYSESGKQGVLSMTQNMMRYLFIGVSFIIIPSLVFAPTLIKYIYSMEYAQYGLVPFRIICCVGFVLAVSRPLDMALRVIEQVRLRSLISLVELAFVAVCMFPAVHLAGITGATIVVLLGRILVALCLTVSISRVKSEPAHLLHQTFGQPLDRLQ